MFSKYLSVFLSIYPSIQPFIHPLTYLSSTNCLSVDVFFQEVDNNNATDRDAAQCVTATTLFTAIIKRPWLVRQRIFQGLFLLSEGSEKKNLSAGEIKPFFFRGEKWNSRLSTLKCYSGF